MKRKRSEPKEAEPIILIGNGVNCPDVAYASGFHSPDDVVFLRAARRYLVVVDLEYGRARRVAQERGIEVLTPTMLGLSGKNARSTSGWAVAVLKKARVRRVVVPAYFPHGAAMQIEAAGIRVRLADGALFPERARKTPREIRYMRETQQAAVIATRVAVDMIARSEIHPSGELRLRGKVLTSEIVRREIARVLLQNDCFCRETIVAGGQQAADPHEQGSGPLRAHEAIVIDIFPQHLVHGYWGDITRTVVRGTAAPELRRMYHAVRAAHHAALTRIQPGARCGSVHRAAAKELEKRGFRTGAQNGRPVGFIHSTGHGVGLSVHEWPSVSRNEERLRPGHVVTVEPGLYYPECGGVRVEDTVVVTPGGWAYLVPCEKRFEV